MKRIFLIAAVLALAAGLASCGEGKDAVSSQASQPSAASSQTASADKKKTRDTEFSWGDVKVGMTYDEVTAALGEAAPQELEGRTYTAYVYEDVTGMKPGSETTVVFVFNAQKKLEEIQYIIGKQDNVSYAEMVDVYEQLYGAPYTSKDDGNRTAAWMFRNGYLDITEINQGDNLFSVTFYEKQYYEKEFPVMAAGAQEQAR